MAKQASARRSARSIEQALALHRQGKLDEADRIYGNLLGADPHNFDALYLAGMLRHQQGRSVEGLRMVAAALKAKPGAADARMNYGAILLALERHEEALASFDQALAMRTGDAAVHYNRGNALKGLGRHEEALASYDRALALAPDLAVAHHNRGSTLAELDRYEEALASYDCALELKPELADRINALNNRGKMLAKLRRFDEALAGYDQVLALAPNHVDALTRRGVALAELGRYDEALAAYAAALRIDPDYIDAYVNRGNVYAFFCRFDAALTDYTAATARQPEHADANFNEALVRLSLGDFRRGWPKYEYRWQCKQYASARPNFPRPVWRGDQDLSGKTILLCAEQGMGDAIQFVRYAPLIAARGAKVLVGAHRPLAAVLSSVPGVAQVIADGESLPDFDLYCPLLSLPLAFGTELATIPSTVPYIRPQPDRVTRWEGRVPQNGRLRVGVCWAGTSLHRGDRHRSIPIETFAKIMSVGGVDFVSLQKDVSDTQSAILREHGVLQLGQEFADFADTAAVIAMLDLVISVDTSVAHLAGAMGRATGVLIPFSPDFRWLLERTDSPWYPTMRFYRQSAIGRWETPVNRLHAELEAVARRRASRANSRDRQTWV
ncbi:MAG: tetratricopeptide repeat protein [Xanthobacteraceae bacterium]